MAGVNRPPGDALDQQELPTGQMVAVAGTTEAMNAQGQMPTVEQGAPDVQEWIEIAEQQMNLAIQTRQRVQAMLANTIATNPTMNTMEPTPTEPPTNVRAENDLPLAG